MARAPRGTGSVQQRTGRRPQIRVYIDGRRQTFTGRTVAEARAKANEARRTHRAEITHGPTVREWLIQWLEQTRDTLRSQTWIAYEKNSRLHIEPELGHFLLSELSPEALDSWHRRLRKKLGPTTVHHVHTALMTALKAARQHQLPVPEALFSLPTPPRKRRTIETLSREEALQVIKTAGGDPWEGIFILALTVGLRSGELRGLRWEDVNLPQSAIRIRANATRALDGRHVLTDPKTAAGIRTISPLPAVVRQALEHTPREGTLVWAGSGGHPIPHTTLDRAWERLCRRAGVRYLPFHALRHTAATHALEDGIPPHVVANMLGHASVATTLHVYAHVTRVSSEAVARAVDARYGATE